MSGDKPDIYEQLKGKRSLAEILDAAIAFELAARDLYAGLIPNVSKRLRYLVEELAQEEQHHFELFSELRVRSDIAEHLSDMVVIPASDRRFSDAIHIPELGNKPDDQSVLQYAMGREHVAMEQYRALAESTADGPIKDLFSFLADEETKHKNELETLYYSIVHSGGV